VKERVLELELEPAQGRFFQGVGVQAVSALARQAQVRPALMGWAVAALVGLARVAMLFAAGAARACRSRGDQTWDQHGF
jgi:hypothetical protein